MDRSLGKVAVAEALREAGAQVEVHDDHFPRDTADAVWIPEVSRQGWIILTKDAAIRKRPLELAAVIASKARVFALTSQHIPGSKMADVFAKRLKRMRNVARSHPRPF